MVLPRRVAEELKRRGVDVEPLVVDFLVGLLKLEPQAAAESHLELAVRYLEEGGTSSTGTLFRLARSSIGLRRRLSRRLQRTST